jgi:hypothetical protein
MLKEVFVEYYLIQEDGDGRFGSFQTEHEAFECVVREQLSDYRLVKILSHIPF